MRINVFGRCEDAALMIIIIADEIYGHSSSEES